MIDFQTEHIETDLYQELKSMTIVIAIKSKEGIVIASDSQGTGNGIKYQLKKYIKFMNLLD